jgi:hypothetical protein
MEQSHAQWRIFDVEMGFKYYIVGWLGVVTARQK